MKHSGEGKEDKEKTTGKRREKVSLMLEKLMHHQLGAA